MENYTASMTAKMKTLSSAGAIPSWRFKVGASDEACQPGFDDSAWETVTLHHNWSSLDGEAWFRAALQPPAVVAGLPLTGSQVYLDIFLATGATVYINGEARYFEPSWVDTRPVPLGLFDSFIPGAPIHLAVRCKAGDSFALFLSAGLRFSRMDEAIFELDLLKAQLDFTAFLAGQRGDPILAAARQSAAAALDLAALERDDWDAWTKSVAAARTLLQPFAALAKTYTANLVAHSHIDMNWLWPTRETVDVCRRDFSSMDRLMGTYPEYYFSQSQAAVYKFMEDQHPEVFERIRQRVAEGRWEITANTWVEGDLNMAASESLARHFLQARRYIATRFGVTPRMGWEPDTFGHTAAMPQLLTQVGVPYYYFCRAGHKHPLFWWEGEDGSRILAVQDPRGYGGVITPSGLAAAVMDFAGRYKVHTGLFVYGAGDHGGGGTAGDIERARAIDAAPFLPHALPGPAARFFDAVLSEKPDLPVVRGELNTVFEGCYTSHTDIKMLNRRSENDLLSAESVMASAARLTGASAGDLTAAWQTLCFHQFHDILCGCAIGVTYQEAHEKMSRVGEIAAGTASAALQALVAAADTRLTEESSGLAWRIAVFNPLAAPRTDVVRLPLSQLAGFATLWPGEGLSFSGLLDPAGHFIPVQVCGKDLIFIAPALPALGLAVFRPVTSQPVGVPSASGAPVDSPAANTLENGLLRFRVNPASGAIDQLVDLTTSRHLSGQGAGWGPESQVSSGMLNRLQVLWEQPHAMSAWNLGDISRVDHLVTGAGVRVVESGPVRGTIEVRRSFLHSSLVQRVVLYSGLSRIDFETEIDWHERGSAHEDAPMLRATFTPAFGHTHATFETAFSAIDRPADGREVPALRWADLSETGGDQPYGLSLLNNGRYGHHAQGNTLGLTLVRASYEPDVNPDERLHRFTYSIYPHAGGWQSAGTLQQAAGLNQPVLATLTSAHPGSIQPGGAGLSVSVPGVVISAVKLAEDQSAGQPAVIVRLYEVFGQACQAILQVGWPVQHVEEVTLEETPAGDRPALTLSGGSVSLAFKPHEIKTLRLT